MPTKGTVGRQRDAAGHHQCHRLADHRHRLGQPQAFPFESPSRRFQLVTQPVTYVCDKVAKTLNRYAGYGFNATQIAPTGTPALIASAVSDCNFRIPASNSPGAPAW